MADNTYQTKVYLAQGGDKIVVTDGGKIEIETGGQLVINGVSFPTTLGTAGQVLTVNAGGTGLEYKTPAA
jgi:hypothetical protein